MGCNVFLQSWAGGRTLQIFADYILKCDCVHACVQEATQKVGLWQVLSRGGYRGWVWGPCCGLSGLFMEAPLSSATAQL